MVELLTLPTKPRNETEEHLLDEIVIDPNLENPRLRDRVIEYMKGLYSIVAWRHSPAAITRYSFEDSKLAKITHDSYDGSPPIPRIVGILGPVELGYQ